MGRIRSRAKVEQVSAEVDGLTALNATELDQRWRTLFGTERPPRIYGRLLLGALAYRLQEKALGALNPSTRRLLRQIAGIAATRRPGAPIPTPRLKPGAELIRDWHGVTHRVTVLQDGFQFCAKRFRSLSEIARTITGSRWSGPLFFGLKAATRGQKHGAK